MPHLGSNGSGNINHRAANERKMKTKMAYVTSSVRVGVAQQGEGMMARIKEALRRRKVFNQTYRELSALSTRDLDDLGINRSMITRMAMEAAARK